MTCCIELTQRIRPNMEISRFGFLTPTEGIIMKTDPYISIAISSQFKLITQIIPISACDYLELRSKV